MSAPPAGVRPVQGPDAVIAQLLGDGVSVERIVAIGVHRGSRAAPAWTRSDVERIAAHLDRTARARPATGGGGKRRYVHGVPDSLPQPAQGATSYVKVVRAGELFADPTYQRDLNENWVRQRIDSFDERLFGLLEVSDRGEGHAPRRYAIVDGQQRHALIVEASPDGEDTPVAVRVHLGLTVTDEARMMAALDRNRRKHTTWDQWKARRAAGEDAVLDIEGIAAGHELRFAATPAPGVITATGTAERLYTRGGPGLLDAVLGVLHAAWGGDPTAYTAAFLTAVGQLIHDHGERIDVHHLAAVLSLADSRPWDVRATANSYKTSMGRSGNTAQLIAQVAVDRYNRTARDAGVPRLPVMHP
jgi:hypothetical protein